MMIPEMTIGITKIARRPVLNRIRETSPTARRNASTFTTITVTIENPNVNR